MTSEKNVTSQWWRAFNYKLRAPKRDYNLGFDDLPYRPFFDAGPSNAGPNSAGFENEANAY